MLQEKDYIEDLPNSAELELIFVEGGSYKGNAIPNFHLGKYPITNEQFVPFLNAMGNQEEGGTNWVNMEGEYEGVRSGIVRNKNRFVCISELRRHPMIYVSWYGARAFCKWLSEKTGKKYGLPKEVEWEYAARGGKHEDAYPFSGGNKLKELGWYRLNSHGELKRVGLKKPNRLGLYDISGNVWEWCTDFYNEKEYKNAQVVRGGAWSSNNYVCRVSIRLRGRDDNRNDNTGFRIVRY